MLRLVAVDAADLSIISAQMQDALVLRSDMQFEPKRRRFSLVANRFLWDDLPGKKRCRVGLHFDDVASVQVQGFDHMAPHTVLSLLAISFQKDAGLAGLVKLAFSADVTMRLQVDCINAMLSDLSGPWGATRIPEHIA